MVGEPGEGPTDDRTVAQLISEASEQVSRLVREEMQLVAVELRQKGAHLGAGAGLVGIAGVLAFYGGGALVACAVLALALVLAPWLAALLVGAVVLLIAGVLALMGKKQVQAAVPPVPENAVTSVRKDVEAVKEGLHR
jgi:membrane protein